MHRLPACLTALAALGAVGALAPTAAHASPWTLPQSKVVLYAGADYQFTTREFLDVRRSQVFPLAGQYDATSFTLGARVGLTDRFEVEVSMPFRVVNYTSDPVALLPQPADSTQSSLDFYQENIVDLSQSQSGLGDFRFTARYGLFRRPVAVAIEVGFKTPTGYRGPSGTFGDRPESAEAFASEPGRFVNGDNVQDDVTLGDAQLDVSPRLLIGYALSTGTFFRAAIGYDWRLAGAGDQIYADFKMGQVLSKRFLVYAGAQMVYAVQEGRVIGVSVAAIDPTVPAEDYGGLTNLLLREVTLDRDAVDVNAGVIFRPTNRFEVNLGYQHTVWGRNTAAVQAVFSSVAFRTDLGLE